MLNIAAEQVRSAATYAELGKSISSALSRGLCSPDRNHHTLPQRAAPDGTLLLMPSWDLPAYLGVKIATVFPGNASRCLAAVNSQYILMNGATGTPLALIDGNELTARRTAAASALAATYLRRQPTRSILIIGTGTLAPHLALAHYENIAQPPNLRVWGRSKAKAQRVCNNLQEQGIDASVAIDLEKAIASSNLISVGTLSTKPLVCGKWLQPGTHVDLVGGFTPLMREADDATIRRASIFCDSVSAVQEAGDLCQPIANGVLDPDRITSLAELCSGKNPGRRSSDEITLFKSAGFAVEDLACAILIYERTLRATCQGTPE